MLNLSATLIAFLSFVAAKVPKKITPTQWRSEINSGQTGVLAQNGQFESRAYCVVHGSIIVKSI